MWHEATKNPDGCLVRRIYSPALAAEYYVVQDPSTKRCTIVEQRPARQILGSALVLGPLSFGVRTEAENQLIFGGRHLREVLKAYCL